MRIKSLVSIIILIITLICHKATADDSVFPISTEIQIGKMKPLIERAPKGIYLTVGGERAFRGASMFEGIDSLIVFDISPTIIRFNKINIELLKANNKEDYKNLRWNADFNAWKKVSATLTEDDFKWWNENIRNIKGYNIPEVLNKTGHTTRYVEIRDKLLAIYPKISSRFNNRERVYLTFVTWADIEKIQSNIANKVTKEEMEWFISERANPESCVPKLIDEPISAVDWGDIIDYKYGNYLFDSKLYARLHDLVVNNKITVVEGDLGTQKGMEAVINIIKKGDAKLAFLDLDNLYISYYMGEEKYRNAISSLLSYGTNDSILSVMSNYKDYPCIQFSMYIGFTFENIKTWPKEIFLDRLISSAPQDVAALWNGRLYQGRDKLPMYLPTNKDIMD